MHLSHIFSETKNLVTDFLFPKSERVIELEKMSSSKMLKNLPKAEASKDDSTICLFDYSHPLVKEIVWEIKYNGNRKLAQTVGEIIYDTIISECDENLVGAESESMRPAVVPVPISDKRRFERGWNQTEIIAELVLKNDKGKRFKYLARQLTKNFHTESQTKTGSRSERLRNLTNSMRVLNPASVAGRTVFLLDDVYTTGATFKEASRALKAAGAKRIIPIAIAH